MHDLFSETRICKDFFQCGLAIVKVAANGPDVDVAAGGGYHLFALNIAHAAIGK